MISASPRQVGYAISACLMAGGLFAQPSQTPQAPPAAKAQQAPRIDFPAASPKSTLQQRVGSVDIEIVYYRPGLKGRDMIGKNEPYGEVYRTGANNATTIAFSKDVKIGGKDVPAGKYALFTIPNPNEWTVIINKGAAQWGAFTYDQAADLVRVNVKPVKLSQPVETLEIGINDIRDGSATINITWENVRVPVPLTIDLTPLLKQIDEAMAGTGRKPYADAAALYLDNGLDLKKALEWADADIAAAANQTNVHLKAKILAKMGDKAGAIAAANQSIELATKSNNATIAQEYTKMNKNLIARLR